MNALCLVCELVLPTLASAKPVLTEDLKALDCTGPLRQRKDKPRTAKFVGSGTAHVSDRARALDNAYCDAVGAAFRSVGVAKMPYPCSAYGTWRLGENAIKEKVIKKVEGAKTVSSLQVTATFKINTSYRKDSLLAERVKPGGRLALLVVEKAPGADTTLINGRVIRYSVHAWLRHWEHAALRWGRTWSSLQPRAQH